MGRPGAPAGDAVVTVGRNARLYYTTPILVQSGTLVSYTNTAVGADTAAVTIKGGAIYLKGTGAYSTFDIWTGGTLYAGGFGTNTLTGKIQLFGGTLDCRLATDAQLAADLNAYSGAKIYDPNGLVVSTIEFIGCKESECTLDLPTNRLFNIGTTATP